MCAVGICMNCVRQCERFGNGIKTAFPFSFFIIGQSVFFRSKIVVLRRLSSDADQGLTDIPLPPIHDGEFVRDRKSVFQGHLAPVTHRKQVKMVLDKLKENKKIAAATHNIIAFRIECGRDSFVTGCEDDGEIHAGSRMLHLLNIIDARNVMVIVTRWYGGVHLGPDRFKHINNCTRELLEAHGYIRDKMAEKKGPKSRAPSHESPSTTQSHRGGHGQRHGKKGK